MRIDAQNGKVINSNDICIHDWIFREIIFDYTIKKISLVLENIFLENKKVVIDFFNVIGFQMTTSDFWGKSLHVLDWEYLQDGEMIHCLFAEKKQNNYIYSRLDDEAKYIETSLTCSSGDVLTIACEYIEFQV